MGVLNKSLFSDSDLHADNYLEKTLNLSLAEIKFSFYLACWISARYANYAHHTVTEHC